MQRESSDSSFGSIPEVSFIMDLVSKELSALDVMNQPSEFKLKEMSGELIPEPLLAEDKGRFVLFPIKQPEVSLLSLFLCVLDVSEI
jgi:hypothetical protein